MNPAQIARTRRTAKAFDPARPIPATVLEDLRVLLRHCPSSVNSQPWHFVFAATAAGKARIAAAAAGPYAYNAPKIQNAPLVVVLCVRTDLDDAHLGAVLAQEQKDGRFPAAEDADKQRAARAAYVRLHRDVRRDLRPWMEKQVYLALGALLFGTAALGLDACPMEGFDADALDQALGLAARGLAPVALVALGFSGPGDWNAALPKSRLPPGELFTDA